MMDPPSPDGSCGHQPKIPHQALSSSGEPGLLSLAGTPTAYLDDMMASLQQRRLELLTEEFQRRQQSEIAEENPIDVALGSPAADAPLAGRLGVGTNSDEDLYQLPQVPRGLEPESVLLPQQHFSREARQQYSMSGPMRPYLNQPARTEAMAVGNLEPGTAVGSLGLEGIESVASSSVLARRIPLPTSTHIARHISLFPLRPTAAHGAEMKLNDEDEDDGDDEMDRKRPASGGGGVARAPKRRKQPAEAMLHNACKLFAGKSLAVIGSSLQFDAEAVREAVPTVCFGSSRVRVPIAREGDKASAAAPAVVQFSSFARRSETYSYAINIALKHDALPDVVDLLSTAGPDVLVLPDGPDGMGSLGIALANGAASPHLQRIVDILLAANPQSASIQDRRSNTPLHLAVRCAASSNLLTKIYQAFPKALYISNLHGETPMDTAVRGHAIPESVVDCLQEIIVRTTTSRAA